MQSYFSCNYSTEFILFLANTVRNKKLATKRESVFVKKTKCMLSKPFKELNKTEKPFQGFVKSVQRMSKM